MKGIILAGGTGSRLYPATLAISKQLIPVYDKPMVYYPLSVLMRAGIRDIALISTPRDLPAFKALFGGGEALGLNLSYIEQPKPEGIAQSFILAKDFIGLDTVALILGDNIFYGEGLEKMLLCAAGLKDGAEIFASRVVNPAAYGVISFDKEGKPLLVTEKPSKPASPWAVTGLYFYDNTVIEAASRLKFSARGELEITDINNFYLSSGKLRVNFMGRGMAWLDTGTHEDLIKASTFIESIETRQGIKTACLEEISFRNGWIDRETLLKRAFKMKGTPYGDYLLNRDAEGLWK